MTLEAKTKLGKLAFELAQAIQAKFHLTNAEGRVLREMILDKLKEEA